MEKRKFGTEDLERLKSSFKNIASDIKEGKIENNHPPIYLISFDLDGTILSEDYETLDGFTSLIIKEMLKVYGNTIIVCIATGKKELSSESYYFELGLDKYPLSFLCSYSGAYLRNPASNKGMKETLAVSNAVIKSFLNEKYVKDSAINILIDTEDGTTICTSNSKYFQNVFFDGHPFIKTESFEESINLLGVADVLQIVIEIENSPSLIDNFIKMTNHRYKNSINLYKSTNLKEEKGKNYLVPDDSTVMMRIRSSNADKSFRMEALCRYLNINPATNWIAFGDDKNDIKSLSSAYLGVAMKNAPEAIKSEAKSVTNFTNSEGGVGRYLNELLNLGKSYEEYKKNLKSKKD